MGYSGNTSSKVKETFGRLGMSTFFLSRLAWGSVLSWLARNVPDVVEPICFFTYTMQDETPLKMRAGKKGSEKASAVDQTQAEKAVVKLIQSELHCGFIVREREGDRGFRVIWAELPTCLQQVRDTTGVSLKHAMEKLLEAPLARGVMNLFPLVIDLSSGDRAKSNFRMENLFALANPSIPRLSGLGCQVH